MPALLTSTSIFPNCSTVRATPASTCCSFVTSMTTPRALHPLQRRVGDETAVPIELTIYFDCRTAGRQRAARHDVLGPDLVGRRIEIDEIAAADVDGADAEPHLAGIDAVEIDEALECAAQRRGVIPADSLDRAR